jgi:hypothetical protein
MQMHHLILKPYLKFQNLKNSEQARTSSVHRHAP